MMLMQWEKIKVMQSAPPILFEDRTMSVRISDTIGRKRTVTPMVEPRPFGKRATNSKTRRAFLTAAAGILSTVTNNCPILHASSLPAAQRSFRWCVFYGTTTDEATLKTYDLVVLDPGYKGSISQITCTGTKVCGYLSLGEIRTTDPFLELLDPAALLPENPDWPGIRRVDIRHPSWRSLVLERIPSLETQAFTGLMLDTLDTPPYLELLDPTRYRGMREAAVELVGCIRRRWPGMMLIMNRGYALLPDVVQNIDAVIAESLLTSPDQKTGKISWLDSSQVESQLALLYPVASRRPPVPILSLDYWDPGDARSIAEIYRRERLIGHHPYVATRLLDQIVPEGR
jgi:polysaccharide biosynthesis protein PelA